MPKGSPRATRSRADHGKASAAQADPVLLLAADAPRLVLAGAPGGGGEPTDGATALRPKDLLLALAGIAATGSGRQVRRANPHFLPADGAAVAQAVAHFSALDVACPLPGCRNTLVLDGEDLLDLAEEHQAEASAGVHRLRAGLMDGLLTVAPPGLEARALLGRSPAPLQVAALLRPLSAPEALPPGPAPHPVRWRPCDLETGHYNYLGLKHSPGLTVSELGLLRDPAFEGSKSVLAFATPRSLPEIAPALRAFAAIADPRQQGEERRFILLFFGTPEAFGAAVGAPPDGLFFGDNFRCPAIRIVFAPFTTIDVLGVIRRARLVIDGCYGGVLDALARELGVARRIILGPAGTLDAETGAGPALRGIDWPALLERPLLQQRRQKADRRGEIRLAELIEAML